MLIKITVLLAVLTIFSSGTTNADSDITIYEYYQSGELNKGQQPVVESMGAVLNNHNYKIQPETSKVEFRVDTPIGEISASFQDFGGSFCMIKTGSHKKPAVIDISSESLETNSGFIGMMLRSDSFFDVGKFPSMHFVGSSFEWFDDTHAILKGDMTIKNVTMQVAFYVELIDSKVKNKDSQRVTMKASANIKRSEFGIHSLLPVVSDNVSLLVSIDAMKRDTSITASIAMLH